MFAPSIFGLPGPRLHDLDLPEQHPADHPKVPDEAQPCSQEGVAAAHADEDNSHANEKGLCPNNFTSATLPCLR